MCLMKYLMVLVLTVNLSLSRYGELFPAIICSKFSALKIILFEMIFKYLTIMLFPLKIC